MSAPKPARAAGRATDHEAAIRAFIEAEASTLSPATASRYAIVTESLFEFLDVVDVRHRFGPEIAHHLAAERERLGTGAFLPTLGIASLLRVLPGFLDDPWLPPRGQQRASHRFVVDRLLVFLRRRGLVDSAALRPEFTRVRRAIGTARSRDYGLWSVDEPTVDDEVIDVTVGLRSAVLDPLLAAVERGEHESLAAAIEACLSPDPMAVGAALWTAPAACGRPVGGRP